MPGSERNVPYSQKEHTIWPVSSLYLPWGGVGVRVVILKLRVY